MGNIKQIMASHEVSISFFHTGNIICIKDVSLLQKKSKEYAEETRQMLLKNVQKKQSTVPLSQKLYKSEANICSKQFLLPKPRKLPPIHTTDETLNAGLFSTISVDKSKSVDEVKPKAQSLYDLHIKDCDAVQNKLVGMDKDLTLSISRSRSHSSQPSLIPLQHLSLMMYTANQKTQPITHRLNTQTQDSTFKRKEFNFFHDFHQLSEYESIHQNNILSLVTRDLDCVNTQNFFEMTDDLFLEMVNNLIVHVISTDFVNLRFTAELEMHLDSFSDKCEDEPYIISQIKNCFGKLDRSEFITFKAIVGHIRRLAIIYGYEYCIRGLTMLFTDLLFYTESAYAAYAEKLLDRTPLELYERLFNCHGPLTRLSNIFEFIIKYYNKLF